MTISPAWRRTPLSMVSALTIVATFASTSGASDGFLTAQPPMLTLSPSVPAGSSVLPIINSGEMLGTFTFEGIPDGIGAMPGATAGTVDVFVNHEQSHVPFPPTLADVADASVSRLTLDTTPDGTVGGVLAASVPIPPSAGYLRLCSSTMAGPPEGLDRYLYFTNEESNDVVPVPSGAPYGPDPSLAPNRQAGYSVVLDPATGVFTQVPGMGRHNHENTMVVPGGWEQIAVLSGDDTFFSRTPDWSQLFLYLADDEDALIADHGSLWAFRVTHTDEGKVDEADPFNGANDYGDIGSGEAWRGRFIHVPKVIARGLTTDRPQNALEDWSNANNVFQFIRVEDTAYDKSNPRVVYIADTGDRRMVPDPTTGRLMRNPSSGPFGAFPNGRVYRMEFSVDNPRKVVSFSILVNADANEPTGLAATAIHQPDNMGTSTHSLMVQEDSSQAPNSRVWRYDFMTGTWSVVASVNDRDWESSGIVDVSAWFGPGSWLLDVQAHDVFVTFIPGSPVSLKREGGQLLLMRIPGS
ncbi:MAG: hypothetical protein ACRDH0_02255 [Actinomycetota bacterium]